MTDQEKIKAYEEAVRDIRSAPQHIKNYHAQLYHDFVIDAILAKLDERLNNYGN